MSGPPGMSPPLLPQAGDAAPQALAGAEPSPWPSHLRPFFWDEGERGAASLRTAAAPGAAAVAEARRAAAVHELLTFLVGAQLYAVPIVDVWEVSHGVQPTRLPRMGPHVLGLMSLRGHLLPVIDLAHILAPTLAREVPHAQPRGPLRTVVLRDEAAPLGLCVRQVVGVRRLAAEELVQRTGLSAEAEKQDNTLVRAYAQAADHQSVAVLSADALRRRFATI